MVAREVPGTCQQVPAPQASSPRNSEACRGIDTPAVADSPLACAQPSPLGQHHPQTPIRSRADADATGAAVVKQAIPLTRKQPYPGSVIRLISAEAPQRLLTPSPEEEREVERSPTKPELTVGDGAVAQPGTLEVSMTSSSMLASEFSSSSHNNGMSPSSFPDRSFKDHGWTASFRRHSYGGPSDGDDVLESWNSASSLLTDRVVGVKELEDPYDTKKLCPGDIILRVGPDTPTALRSPFPKGLESVRSEFGRCKGEKVTVLVQRGREQVEVQADIQAGYLYTRVKGAVLEEGSESRFKVIYENTLDAKEAAELRADELKKQRINDMVQLIASIHDAIPNPTVSDRPPRQGADGQLACAYSILVLPCEIPAASMFVSPTVRNFNHTSQRALDWLNSTNADGLNLRFLSIQSEPLPGQVKGAGRSTGGRYSKLYDDACAGGRWEGCMNDNEELTVTRACRLAYAPAREVQVQMQTTDDVKSFGIVLSRSKWGFIHIMDVQPDSLAARCGVKALLDEAQENQKELVLLRLEGQCMVPSMITDHDQIYACKLTAIMQSMVMFAQLRKPLWLSLGV